MLLNTMGWIPGQNNSYVSPTVLLWVDEWREIFPFLLPLQTPNWTISEAWLMHRSKILGGLAGCNRRRELGSPLLWWCFGFNPAILKGAFPSLWQVNASIKNKGKCTVLRDTVLLIMHFCRFDQLMTLLKYIRSDDKLCISNWCNTKNMKQPSELYKWPWNLQNGLRNSALFTSSKESSSSQSSPNISPCQQTIRRK